MKKKALSASALMAGLVAFALTSCGGDNKNQAPVQADNSAETQAQAMLNIRYVDGDSITAQYQGFIDLNEEHMRALQRLDNAQQAKASEIQRFASNIEQKRRSNGYLTQESLEGDMARLQKMQQDAESYMANLARKADVELAQRQTALQDSIDRFIKAYNAGKGYDAILLRASGLYFNPALDITKEVVDGLNAGYSAKAPESK